MTFSLRKRLVTAGNDTFHHWGVHLPAHSERVMDWICSVFWVFNRLWRVLTIPVGERSPASKLNKPTGVFDWEMFVWRHEKHQSYQSSHSACRAPFYPVVCGHSGFCSTLPRLPCSASCWQRHKNPARHLWQAEQHFSSIGQTSHQQLAAWTDNATSIPS